MKFDWTQAIALFLAFGGVAAAGGILIVNGLHNSHDVDSVNTPVVETKFIGNKYVQDRIGVWTDPETKCDYIVSARGGIHIRYSAEGMHMCEGQYGDGL